jgi:signal transduction histidine kinase/CheY-like chemotaxis protein
MTEFHSLLKRQVRRYLSESLAQSEALEKFLQAVDEAYRQFDDDRAMLERSMELSSQELLEANASLRAVLASFPDVIFWLEADGTIVDCKAGSSKIAHGSIDKLVGIRLQDVSGTKAGALINSAVTFVRNLGEQKMLEYQLESGGRNTYHEMRLYPAEGGRIIAIVRETTEKKRAQEEKTRLQDQLQEARKMEAIGRLAGGIAHDFNNILFSILGFGQLIARRTDVDSLIHRNIQEVIRAGNRGKELVEQILIFSRWRERQRAIIRLDKSVNEVLAMIQHTIPSNVEIQKMIAPQLRPMIGDPAQIHQTLHNICSNAVQAMQGAPGALSISVQEITLDDSIWVSARELVAGDYLEVVISDDGHGMTPDVLKRIFEPFFTTKEVGQGTGLGLAAVHGIIEDHGGGIFVESEVASGTVFRLWFPVSEDVADLEDDRLDAPVFGTGTVLVVDDEQTVASLLSQMLDTLGYDVVFLTDPVEALEVFKQDPSKFDLVITDQTMPRLKGMDLAAKIFALNTNTPVILCTGFSEDISPEEAVRAGCFKCLIKPLQLEVLAKYVGDAIGSGKKDTAS